VKVPALILGVAILAVAIWSASELHYRACVSGAAARTPVRVTQHPAPDALGPAGAISTVRGIPARQRAVDGCSRLPF
jgi:hypothetical protein